jgi:hypothetical protein
MQFDQLNRREFITLIAAWLPPTGHPMRRRQFIPAKIVVDLHHLLLAGLPAHFESYMPSDHRTAGIAGRRRRNADPIIPVNVGDNLGIFKKHGLDRRMNIGWIQRKVRNGIAGLAAAGSSRHRQKIAINNDSAFVWPGVEGLRAGGSTGSDCKIRGCRRSPPARTFRRLADCNCKKRNRPYLCPRTTAFEWLG